MFLQLINNLFQKKFYETAPSLINQKAKAVPVHGEASKKTKEARNIEPGDYNFSNLLECVIHQAQSRHPEVIHRLRHNTLPGDIKMSPGSVLP